VAITLRRPKHPGRVLIVSLIALGAINVLIWGGLGQVNGPAAVQRPVAIVDLQPAEGVLTPPQGQVGAQVRTNFTAQLIVDGQLIPQDEITGDPNLGEYFFEPGPGRTYRELPHGRNSAVVQWWPRNISTPEQAKAEGKLSSYSWVFNVG
jgi:hypothetical protein